MSKKVDIQDIENRLWDAADELRANSELKESEYSIPVLGLIFLKYADSRFTATEKEIAYQGSGRRKIGKTDYQTKGVMYLPEDARFARLLELPEGADLGKALNDAMKAIEDDNEDLRGVLPRTYQALSNSTLRTLLRNVNSIFGDIDGDGFGKVYEYFLGKFAMAEGQKGGQFFTPTSIVKLIVEIIEPFKGKILDPTFMCNSGVSRDSHGERQTWLGTGATRTGVGACSDLRGRERTRRTPICGFRTIEDATL